MRAAAGYVESLAIPLGALLAAALLFGGFVALMGADPVGVYESMYKGAFGTWFSWQNTLQRAAPLMLTALCTALPARLGLILIGGEGALVVGGLAAAMVGLYLEGAPRAMGITGMIGAAALAGGAWVSLVGALRHYRGVNETISSLLFNYLGIALLLHLVTGPMRDAASLNKPSTAHIGEEYMLGTLPGMDVHWGLVLGLIACLITYVLFLCTPFGFSVRVIGGNVRAARLVGLSVGRVLLVTCFIAGAAAGIAGMVEVAAVHGRANESLIAGYGYAGILVAFLARQNPLTIIPVAILLGGIGASGGLLQRTHHLPDAAVLVLQGLVFVVILLSETMRGRLSGLAKGGP